MKTTTFTRSIIRWSVFIGLFMIISASATAGEQERNVSGFTELQVNGPFKVILTQGTSEKLMLEADNRVMEKIITEVRNGTLIIRARRGVFNLNNSGVTVYLTFINLDELELSGAANLKGTHAMKFADLEIEGSGSTIIALDLSATSLSCELSGASLLTLTGNAPDMEIESSGASKIDAGNFLTRSCDIECSGASAITVYVTESLSVEASGASNIFYKGDPGIAETELSGASNISKI